MKQDRAEALRWYQRAFAWNRIAADQGDTEAEFQVGLAYEGGAGVTGDDGVALTWFLKAAARGDEMAQFNLGATFEHEPAHQDLAKARYWYGKAAAQDYGHAKDALARLGK